MSTTKEQGFFEDLDLKGAAIDAGSLLGGMVAGNVVVKLVKQDNAKGNGVLALAGLGGYTVMKNKSNIPQWAKMLTLGVGLYSGLRLLTIGMQEATNPETTEGLAGFLPDSLKAKMRKFIPSLSGIEDRGLFAGVDDGDEDINLDDIGAVEDIDYEDVTSDVSGVVDVRRMVA